MRHNVRAGITGYAQVYGKYASDYHSKLKFDLLYIKCYSLTLDVKILLQTIKILFDKVSSAGVDDEEEPSAKKCIVLWRKMRLSISINSVTRVLKIHNKELKK